MASPQTRLVTAARLRPPPHLPPAELERARRLHRTQLRYALAAVGLLAAWLAGLPVLLAAVPALDGVRLLGVPVSWLLVAPTPFVGLVGLAGWHLRRAERAGGAAPVIGVAILVVVGVTLLIGARGVAAMRTTSDFLVASRRISPALNAAAVSGEYLSAASFLGVAGLVVKQGMGALWYPVGFTAGYVAMLALVAAPMRRTGALTVPDFAEARLGSQPLRRLAAVVVVVIATLYLVPQFQAAGQVLTVVSGTPYWVGVVAAGGAVASRSRSAVCARRPTCRPSSSASS